MLNPSFTPPFWLKRWWTQVWRFFAKQIIWILADLVAVVTWWMLLCKHFFRPNLSCLFSYLILPTEKPHLTAKQKEKADEEVLQHSLGPFLHNLAEIILLRQVCGSSHHRRHPSWTKILQVQVSFLPKSGQIGWAFFPSLFILKSFLFEPVKKLFQARW